MTIVFSESAQKERGPAFKSGSEPAILAALPIACVVCDAAGAVVWHNAAAARLFAGVLAPGRLLLELLRPEIPAAVDALLSGMDNDALRVIAPGSLERSQLYLRAGSLDRDQRMPPLGSARPDAAFLELLETWILALDSVDE